MCCAVAVLWLWLCYALLLCKGFYPTDDDAARNASIINLTNAGGRTVISFTATEYVPLSGQRRVSYDVGSVSSAGLLKGRCCCVCVFVYVYVCVSLG